MLVDQELLFTFCQKELKNKEVNNSSKAVEVEKDQFSNSLTKIFIFFSPPRTLEKLERAVPYLKCNMI